MDREARVKPVSLTLPRLIACITFMAVFAMSARISMDADTWWHLRAGQWIVENRAIPREVRILQLRYGLLDGQAYTLEEVGRKMGVTRERVRQIEAQALSRLRHPAIRRKLREYLG